MQCKICGGWARQLPPDGAHFLCLERRKRGLATPCLGQQCNQCNGSGHIGTATAGPMLSLELGPKAIQRSIDSVYPKCPNCNGRGIIT